MSRRVARLGVAVAALALAGCERAPRAAAVRVDLAALLPAAEIWVETVELRLGEESAEPALVGGWTAASRRGGDSLWGTGDASTLLLRRADAHAFRIHLLGAAAAPPAEGEPVGVSLNGVEVGRVALGPTAARVSVEVPAGTARPGDNRLELRYLRFPPLGGGAAGDETGDETDEDGVRERRRRVVSWHGLRIDAGRAPAGAAGAAASPAPAGALSFPAGTGLDLYLRLTGGARLELEGVEATGGARLEADLACEDEPERIGLAEGRASIELRRARAEPATCRLRLRAEPPEQRVAAAGVQVRAAALVQAPPPAPAGTDPAPVAAAAAPSVPPVAAAPPANLLVYIVDTLRADRLGCYGYDRPLTPAIDRFASEGVLFEHARAQSSWTRPTVATMLTGLTPIRLGATGRFSRVPAEAETVAERLKAAGYRTAYVTANGNTAAAFGFDQGVDFFRQIRPKERRSGGDPADELGGWAAVHAAGREFLAGLGAGDRFLLVLHPVEPHAPYSPTRENHRRFARGADRKYGVRKVLTGLPRQRPDPTGPIAKQVSDLYDAEVAGTDQGFAELLAELGRAGRLDDTAILFVSDHGEELFDHGNVEHGRTLFEEQLRVPMIWRLPGGRGGGRRVAARVDQLDVAPTLLELAGIPVPAELPGRSLAATLAGAPPPAESSSPAWLERLQWHQESLLDGDQKLVRNLRPRAIAAPTEERLYDLAADPRERRPDFDSELRRGFLRAQLRLWVHRSGPRLEGGEAVLDEGLREELRALGYLN